MISSSSSSIVFRRLFTPPLLSVAGWLDIIASSPIDGLGVSNDNPRSRRFSPAPNVESAGQ